jgi:hypothetical protein
MERLLAQLVEKLQKAFAGRLVSVVLYGSAAVGDRNRRYSDYNVLCVLRAVTPRELADAEPVFRWWRELGNPAPLLMCEDEIAASTDCFPFGRDLFSGLPINDVFYRAQVEHELRAKLFRLRQKAGGILSEKDLLIRLMADSISTFCTLMRHALVLAGHQPRWPKREVVADAAAKFGLDPTPFERLLDVREEKSKPGELNAANLFENYLRQIQSVVDVVNRLER